MTTSWRWRPAPACPTRCGVLVGHIRAIGWEAHPHFTALTRFWLDRHLGFRRMQGLLVEETEAFLDRARDPGPTRAASCGWRASSSTTCTAITRSRTITTSRC